MATGELQDQFLVQRLDEAHVGDAGVENFRHLQRGLQHRAESQDGDTRPAPAQRFAQHSSLADRQRQGLRFDNGTGTAAARIAHGAGTVVAQAGGEHAAAFVLVARRHQQQVRHATQIAQVEGALVAGAIGTDQAGAVDGEQHRQPLHGHVMNQLVVGALQEG